MPAKIAQHFKLPTVIITGGRGHGMFYTLENLVKKRIFPRECEISHQHGHQTAAQSGQRGITALGDLDLPVSAPLVLPSESNLPVKLAQAFERLDEAESTAECEITIDICEVQHKL